MRLQSRFLITVIPAIAATVLGLGAIVYAQLISSSVQSVQREIQMAQERTALRTAAVVETAETNAVLLSDSAQIANWFTSTPDLRDADAVSSLFRTLRRSQPLYREVRLLDRDGEQEIRVADEDLSSASNSVRGTGWFSRVALNWGSSVHTEVVEHSEEGKPSLTIARPVRIRSDDGRETLQGYVVLSAAMEAIGHEVASHAINHQGYIAMIDATGSVVYASDDRRAQAVAVVDALAEASGTTESRGGIDYVDVDGTRFKVSREALVDGVTTLVVIPGTALDALADRIGLTVGLGTAAAIGLISLLFVYLVRSVVVCPIQRLQKAITALGEGSTEPIIQNARNDEIGDLLRSFASMTEKLSGSMEELQRSNVRIESLAYHDVLTSIPNRRCFLELLSSTVQHAKETSTNVALLFFDLDEFKRLNDSEGHRAGDRLLQEVAHRLTRCASQHGATSDKEGDQNRNVVARTGGDEFVVLLNTISNAKEVAEFAENALERLSQPISIGENARVINASVGFALCPEHSSDADELIACADIAMFDAKRRRTHSWCMYDVSMRQRIDSRLAMEKDLEEAVEGQLCLQYQPQYRVSNRSSGEVSDLWGMEALLRWEHPIHGMVSPAEFIPVAEETGLISAIGDWVINEACRQWTEWNELGIAPDRIAVNVSQRQFSLSDVAITIEDTLKKYVMPPSALEVEITESCIMDASSNVIESLKYIRQLGVHVAMDDFGTGHSSLGALTHLPIDTLKVDRCFVSGIEEGTANDAIIAAVLMLAASLDLTVVAEGVETVEELQRLQWHRCDVGQGYLLARPLWAQDATQLLESRAEAPCVEAEQQANAA